MQYQQDTSQQLNIRMHPLAQALIQVRTLRHQQLFMLSFELLALTLWPTAMLQQSNALTHGDIRVNMAGGENGRGGWGGMFAQINSEQGLAFMLLFIAACLQGRDHVSSTRNVLQSPLCHNLTSNILRCVHY